MIGTIVDAFVREYNWFHIIVVIDLMQVSIRWVTIPPPPLPPHPGAFAPKRVPATGLLHNRKCPGAGPINDDVPGAGH